MQVMEGDLAGTIARSAAHIAHIQIADSPGRHEPGTGEIDYDFSASVSRSHRVRRLGRLRVFASGGHHRWSGLGPNVSGLTHGELQRVSQN